jgi:PKD repeat protein
MRSSTNTLAPGNLKVFAVMFVLCLVLTSSPLIVSAQAATPAPENNICGSCTANPATCPAIRCTVVRPGSVVNGHCVNPTTCQADAVTGISGQTILVGLGIVSAILGIGKQLFGAPPTGGSIPSYTSTNPYGQSTCTGTRYISPVQTSDPCGVYIPTTTTTNPNVNLNPIGGGTSTVVTSGSVSATLSVSPTSGPAPLSVTFTVTDTSTSCSHGAVSISAGDGTPSVTAIPVTISCAGRTPQVLTYTYTTPGTYTATISNSNTAQILQSVPVTVTGSTTSGGTSATLSVSPTSGPAPLSVTFTVTDTSTSCSHGAVSISAGDGTPSVTAIPVTISCAGRTPQVLTYTYTTPGTYTATISDVTTDKILKTVTITVGGSTASDNDKTSATLDIVPASGISPLNVKFIVTDTSSVCPRTEIALSAGDGSASVTALPATVTCIGITPASLNYTYKNAGTFTASLWNVSTKKVIQTGTVTVKQGSQENTTPPLTAPLTAPAASSVNVSSSLLNLANNAGNTGAPRTVPASVKSGTWGDIQINASGVTITAGGHDTDGRTGVAGFYGYNAVQGVTPTDLARQMCTARPWANSSATAIIPPSFYDSICTARGYNPSATTDNSASNSENAAGTSKIKNTGAIEQTSSAGKTTGTTSVKVQTTLPGPVLVTTPVSIFISAVPARIRLGARSTIYWSAKGVTSCVESSEDGSFNGNTLNGAASTVALYGNTEFTITCSTPDGSSASKSVVVETSS